MKNLGKITILLIILLISSLIFLLFIDQILFLDEVLFNAIHGFSNPILDAIFIPITYFGSIILWTFIIVIAWLKKEKKMSIYLIYALIIDSILIFSLKWGFRRSRPESFIKKSFLIERGFGPSFPSGHAERAFSGATIVGFFYKILEYETVFYILAILVGISRIYLGIHYPIDTIFGALFGLIIGNIVLNLPTEKAQEKIDNLLHRIKDYLEQKL